MWTESKWSVSSVDYVTMSHLESLFTTSSYKNANCIYFTPVRIACQKHVCCFQNIRRKRLTPLDPNNPFIAAFHDVCEKRYKNRLLIGFDVIVHFFQRNAIEASNHSTLHGPQSYQRGTFFTGFSNSAYLNTRSRKMTFPHPAWYFLINQQTFPHFLHFPHNSSLVIQNVVTDFNH